MLGQRVSTRRFATAIVGVIFVCVIFIVAQGRAVAQLPVGGMPPNVPLATGQPAAAPPGQPNQVEDRFANQAPVMTFIDPYGQPYGRYVTTETVPAVGYSFQPVKERVFVPKTVTETRTVTQTQYIPFYSYQPQLRNVPTLNPFARPQQVWEYVPILQYQATFVPVQQPITYQKYEEQEVTKMIPVLMNQSVQREKFVDKPINGTQGNLLANASPYAATMYTPYNNNLVQQAAQAALAQRNMPRYPTRPMDYPTNHYGNTNSNSFNAGMPLVAQAPAPYYANNNNGVPASMAFAPTAPTATPPNNSFVLPAVPIRPNVNPSMMAMSPYPQQAASPAATTAARPWFDFPNLAQQQGSLFQGGFFTNNRSPTYAPANSYVASTTYAAQQPFGWGANSNAYAPGFRPVSNNVMTSTPTQSNGWNGASWGMSPSNSYRDPLQGGMPATELR